MSEERNEGGRDQGAEATRAEHGLEEFAVGQQGPQADADKRGTRQSLDDDASKLIIDLEGEMYHLTLTRSGKLILTK